MKKETRTPKTASLRFEKEYFAAGCRVIIGMDEAGRGPLAGPVAAGAVALPLHRDDLPKVLKGARDSKEMNALQRLAADVTIKEIALSWGIGHSSALEIDDSGIICATKLAMRRALCDALERHPVAPDCLFLDYLPWPEQQDYPVCSIVKGDQLSLSIACASIIAKVWRDKYMTALDDRFPEYGFAQNKGYGTQAHLNALGRLGPCEYHRASFKPVRDLLSARTA
ncbi:MAG: ribonuclease HII [Chloroflexi bacterium]|nr:ribonuclease HII [Chloroflexota bacterium]